MKPIIIRGARVVDPSLNLDQQMDVLIEGEKIAAVDKPGTITTSAAQEINAEGLVLTPGLVDVHVHLREPGFEWKETVASGASAAVAGGFTAVCCMPNTNPINDTAQVTRYILDRAKEANLCRVYPIGAITTEEKGEIISEMCELKEAGCVGFSDDGKPVSDANVMRKALEYSKMLDTVLALHEQDLALSANFAMHEGVYSLKLGLRGMPGAAEDVMIARDIELARLTGAPIHFCHVSTARAVTLIQRAKEDGIAVTAEATAHNFTLIDEDVGEYNTMCKMNPPLRTREDLKGITEGIEKGIIDCIASDHAPHEMDSKAKEFEYASFGILGLQTILPLALEKIEQGVFSLKRVIEAMTIAPRRVFKLEPVQIKKGSLADLTLIDLNLKHTFREEINRSKSQNSPFFGWEFKGAAVKTIVAGRVVFDREELTEKGLK